MVAPLVLGRLREMPDSNPPFRKRSIPLDAFHWQLTDATNHRGQRLDYLFVQPSKPVQVDFKVNRFTISNTCNVMSGNYLLNENMVTFSDMVSTRMLCAPQLNTLEQQVAAQFQKKANIDIYLSAAPVMKLRFTDGNTLTFTGRPTAEVRYGGTGETIFRESLHRPVACALRECH